MADTSLIKVGISDRLRAQLERMRSAPERFQYYALDLTASPDGRILWGGQTEFVGFTESKPLREIRRPHLVYGQRMLDRWRKLGMPGLAVYDQPGLSLFLHLGGNAVIEKRLAKRWLADVLRPQEVAPAGALGFRSLASVDPSALKHAPTQKHRMRILKRDRYRCRICGRKPDEDVDIELNVHHFQPWELGGLTVDWNLLTLCRTCHKGLDPHYERDLINIFPEACEMKPLDNRRVDHFTGVRHYQAIVKKLWFGAK